ncbi:phenylacetate-CoA oxygenase subunit PaaJ [Paenibacillus sp. N1-5-1-14]|uniref:1,2-phenylacetyl-CoA epoxidase subunit PaaD n=1 Tax=Paenibacillus radicibacter TaxID=2972488 RepID=UPI0021595ADA|nr:1,2-phenylacetyl-CoA epoxidase subunit PaaD [Paenibacillus radicibacter]MCR8641807.1 phenylacetate-CoA oxygenase subunit PaaJ [Paenibacillus radicibacter]
MEASPNVEREQLLWKLLNEVKDPEIPPVSMVEMGMIYAVQEQDGVITVEVLPTFLGCPALEIMRLAIVEKLSSIEHVFEVQVQFRYDPAWSSNRISDPAREKLKQFGIAPPPRNHNPEDPWEIECPYCNSPYTTLDNLFGPAACRSILYCKSCKNPFEALKPV